MRIYCDRVEQTDGWIHRKELDHMVNWYEKQYSDFNKIFQSQMTERLKQTVYEWTSDYAQIDYVFSFDAVLSPFCVADFLCRHILSTFSYGPENCGDMVNFNSFELGKSWFDYRGDADMMAEILQDYFNQHHTGREIDLNVLLEEREIRSNFAHKGSLELCMSLIRFYNVLRRMLIFMNEDYKVRLVEFQYPEEICCDIQKLAGHFGFDHFENKTTVLIIGSMHDIPQHQLSLIANMPWNIVIDFDGGTTGGGLADAAESSGIHNQLLNQTVANGITISNSITEWLTCGQFLKPSPPTKVKNLFDAKLPFYSGRFHQYYRYVHDTLEPVFEKLENVQNKVSILFMYYDEGILKKVIDLCEEYLDSVSYSLSAVYYWDQEKCENIEKDMYSTYIRNGESYSDRFQIFPCDFTSFFEGLESYEILPSLTKQGADERKLPTGTGLKEVPVNLVTRLEKYFDVLYTNCGEENPADAWKKIRDFHMGSGAPWCAFSNGEVENLIRDEEFNRWIQKIRITLGKLAEINTGKIFNLVHKPGIGGSTMLRYIGWTLHTEYPVLVACKYEKLKIKNLLEDLYDLHSAKGILVLVDEEFDNLEDLERDIKELSRPCAMVISKRAAGNNFSKQDFPFTVITRQAEKRLRHMFRKISPLEQRIVEEKDNAYDDFIHQDASMKSPFFIGLYYIERDFKHLNKYAEQAIKDVYKEQELKALGYIALCDIYGQAALPAVFVNKLLGLHPGSNYLTGDSHVNSVLYYGRVNKGTVCYISRHLLISCEMLEQCSQRLYRDHYKNKLHQWAENFMNAVLDECEERFIENYKTILEKMFIRNKILDNQNESDFSKLIQDCSIPELRKNLLEKLSERSGKLADNTEPTDESPVYMMTAHFYGHLGRLYSRDSIGLTNYGKAVEYSQRSLYYLEKCNGQDSLIYHMYGDALRFHFKAECEDIQKSGASLSNEEFLDLEDKIKEIRRNYNIAAQIGGNIYAATSTIRLLIDYLKFVYECKGISVAEDINGLSDNQQMYRMDIEEMLHSLDSENLDEKDIEIYNNLLDEYQSGIMLGDYSQAIQYFHNRLQHLLAHQGSIREIVMVRQSLVNARLAKYRKDSEYGTSFYAAIPKNEIKDILELLEKSFEQSIDTRSYVERHSRCIAYNKWMNLAKHSEKDISKGLFYAKQWRDLVEMDHRYDPKPYYYLYVLYYLSVLEGNKDDEKYIEKYRRLSYTYANNLGNRVDYIRDLWVAGTGMGQLCDAGVIDDWGELKLKRLTEFQIFKGRFEKVESKRGIVSLISPVKWINRMAKFQTREKNTLTEDQRTHTVCFYGGFSYETITAINSTVRDVTSGEELPKPCISQLNITVTQSRKQEKSSYKESYIKKMDSAETVFFIPEKRYDIPSRVLFYINGHIEGGEDAGIPSSDIAQFGKQINVYGSMDNLVNRLLLLEKIPVICKSYDSKKKRYRVSMYETGSLLDDILNESKEEKAVANTPQTELGDEDTKELPDYQGTIQFTITEIRKNQAFGMFSIDGTSYEGRITSGLSQKMKSAWKKGKNTVTARIIARNQSFYILRA